MEIPDLVQQELGDEEVRAVVNLGDEDTLCLTRTRTLVYRGEGLLSDETVESYPHDFERLEVGEGRRKTTLRLTYDDQKLELSVPNDRADPVLKRIVEGHLRVAGVVDGEETVAGVFRFSELTLVVTERRLLKHLGNVTWDADHETYPYDAVTGLEFEEGSVATSVVLSVDGRPERIKAPSEQAKTVRKTLEGALFSFHDVDSLAELNEAVGVDEDGDEDGGDDRLGLESGIDPLVGGDEAAETADEGAKQEPTTAAAATTDGSRAASASEGASQRGPDEISTGGRDDVAALREQVTELTAAVERQSDQLERQGEQLERQREQLQQQEQTIEKLIEELRHRL
ncbi:DUF7115 domain-containing protein [Haloarcula litorea]|uniref:DUF7115 domain-containing protein n=1 Tax=Haloarcula litorea TaxID=3032579 RepID=UPI0023E7C662|nr:hypothetical protein [Halomicroarcula sp. GDY20]